MLPIRDFNRTRSFPLFNYALIGANLFIFVFFQAAVPAEREAALVRKYALKPAFTVAFVQGKDRIAFEEHLPARDARGRRGFVTRRLIEPLTFWNSIFPLVSSMFLHGGLWHLLGNLWFLYIFGDNVEDRLGSSRYLIFYLFSGLGASIAQIAFDPQSTVPCIGASGAISGVLGAYAVSFPQARILSAIPFLYMIQLVEIPAFVFLFIWFGIQVLSGLVSSPGQGGVAWWAHIGGFIAGIALVKLLFYRPYPARRSPWGRVRDVPFTRT